MKLIESIRKHPWRSFAALVIGGSVLMRIRQSGADAPLPPLEAPDFEEIANLGEDRGKGNLLALQPFMKNGDYAGLDRFREKSDASLDMARRLGYLNSRTVVLFPEYYGTWLVAADERPSVYAMTNLQEALRSVASRHPVRYAAILLKSRSKDRLKEALFRMKAETMAEIYQETFGDLARKYEASIVPGSIVLPDPRIEEGRIRFGTGPLYNVALFFHPDGSLDPKIARKVFPTTDESAFSAPGRREDSPVYDSPAGKIGVLICADCWYPEPYRVLAEKGATSVLVPSYAEKDQMKESWLGYIPTFPTPHDVDSSDVGKIALSEAWMKYALAGRLPESGIPNGILARLQGEFWGLGSDGGATAIREGVVRQAKTVRGSSLINLWL